MLSNVPSSVCNKLRPWSAIHTTSSEMKRFAKWINTSYLGLHRPSPANQDGNGGVRNIQWCDNFLTMFSHLSKISLRSRQSRPHEVLPNLSNFEISPTLSLDSHQNIRLHTGTRANIVLLTSINRSVDVFHWTNHMKNIFKMRVKLN